MINPEIGAYIAKSIAMFGRIPEERRARLKQLARFVQSRVTGSSAAEVTFICTHNSRRSHLAQVWAQTAAAYYGLEHIRTFSGGTEATALAPPAVAALERAGFMIEKSSDDANPVYRISFNDEAAPMAAFSKIYSQAPNPKRDFCAVMTCSDADKNCPIVLGAAERISLPYVDPKAADNTDEETAAYDERCRQISCEMLFTFSLVRHD